MTEEWIDIPDFPDYKVSSRGRVMSIKNYKIIKPFDDKRGYNTVHLYSNGKRYTKKVHRLVAESFMNIEHKGLEVNHIDGYKKNNFIDNLEWCTRSENMIHSYNIRVKSILPKNYRKVKIIETGEIFNTLTECAKHIGGSVSHISACLNGKRQTHKDYHYMEVK